MDAPERRTVEQYATLAENQELIGVYGYYHTSDALMSIGFIVKEKFE